MFLVDKEMEMDEEMDSAFVDGIKRKIWSSDFKSSDLFLKPSTAYVFRIKVLFNVFLNHIKNNKIIKIKY